MTGFYNITTKLKDTLLADAFINTVTFGDIFKVGLNKQDIYPLSHIMVNSASVENSAWRINVSVILMDLVDESEESTTDKFIGNDNEHDVLNTQMAVGNRLIELLRRGDLRSELYQLDGIPTLEPFTDRFDHKVAGWTLTMDILIPNDMTVC